jgi:hypothetical protein
MSLYLIKMIHRIQRYNPLNLMLQLLLIFVETCTQPLDWWPNI